MCGPENAYGLRVPFARDGAQGSRAVYTARPEHEGWPGLLHGGVTFSLMDEALGWALYFQGIAGVTARIETRFRQPISTGATVIVRAWTLAQRGRIISARAEIRLDAENRALAAESDATMYLARKNETTDE